MPVREIGTVRRGRIEPSVVLRLKRSLRSQGTAILHSHTPYPLCVAMLARFLCKAGVIHVHHQHALPSRYQVLAMKTLGRIAPPHAVVAVSGSNAEAVALLTDPSRCKVSIISNGIDMPGADQAWAARHISRVYTVTRLSPVKNVDALIVAMGKVIEQCPTAELNILGDGPLRESLRARAQELGIQDKVRFHGYVFQPERYHAGFGIFVLPSFSEGMSLALLEAMAAGRRATKAAFAGCAMNSGGKCARSFKTA